MTNTREESLDLFRRVMPDYQGVAPIPWKDVAQKLNETGVLDSRGETWNYTTARIFYNNNKKYIDGQEPTSNAVKPIATQEPETQTGPPEALLVKEPVSITRNGMATDGQGEQSEASPDLERTSSGSKQPQNFGAGEPKSVVPIEQKIDSKTSNEIATGPQKATMDEMVRSFESGELREIVEWWTSRKAATAPLSQVPLFRKDLEYKITGVRVKREIAKRASEKLRDPEIRSSYGGSMSNLIEILLWEFIGKPTDVLLGSPHD